MERPSAQLSNGRGLVRIFDQSGLLRDSISGFGLDLQSEFPCPGLLAELAFGREEELGELRPSGIVVAATLEVERALNGITVSFTGHEIRSRAAQGFKGRGETPRLRYQLSREAECVCVFAQAHRFVLGFTA